MNNNTEKALFDQYIHQTMNITAENEYYVGRYSFFKLGMFMMSYDTIIILNIIIIFAKTESD